MSVSDELAELVELKEKGALSDDEFQKAKAKVLSSHVAPAFVRNQPLKSGMGWFGKVLIGVGVLVVGFFVIGLSAGNKVENKLYTGVFRIDSGTEYVALNKPSAIGGACDGWSAVAIQKPGMSSTAMTDIICWKLVDGKMTITDKTGTTRTSGAVSAWSD